MFASLKYSVKLNKLTLFWLQEMYCHYFEVIENLLKPFFRYCPSCKNDSNEVVKAGEKLKQSKKKAKMPSASTESQRDWGKVECILEIAVALIVHVCATSIIPAIYALHRIQYWAAQTIRQCLILPTIYWQLKQWKNY